MNKIEYAVLSYYPSIIATENMNLGIVFHNVDISKREFYTLNNWKKLQNFDDEVDIDFMKMYLKGIKNKIETNIMNYDKEFELNSFTSNYVNELRFSKVQCVETEHIDEFISLTKKVHMRADFEKKERLTITDELKYIKHFMKINYLDYSVKPIVGKYEENISFDYTIGDLGFKNFIFDDKNPKNLIAASKFWAFNAMTLKGNYRTVFVYDNDLKVSDEFNAIFNILKDNSYKVIKRSEVVDLLVKEKINAISPHTISN